LEANYKNIGERIYALRKHLLLSRKEFCRKHSLSEHLLRALELSLISIKPEYSQKLLKAFQAENIICTEEWFLKETGPTLPFSSPKSLV
jgi:transcriptional regulator with XRE-family HTH domain